jgi:CheY-like chemotaxis protein
MYLVVVLLLLLFLLFFSNFIGEIRIRRLRHAKKLAEKSAAIKSATLAVLTHEIRNPLTGLLSLVRLLGNTELDDAQKKLLGTLGNSSRELLALLNTTLEQYRLESGQLTIAPEVFSLADLANNLLALFEGLAVEKGLLLTVQIEPTLPAMLVGDASRIRQILLNLLSNAIKFTTAGIVKLHIEKSAEAGSSITVCFRVIDSGIGMSAETAHQIFVPFSQGSDIQMRFGGTGLGLSISRELARAMGGDIGLESMEGRGSTFTLALPLEIPAGEETFLTHRPASHHLRLASPTAIQPLPSSRPLKLLVVDDTDIHRVAARCLLESAGHRVTLATSGTEAIALLEWQTFACVFIDIHMPDINGIDAIRKIRDMQHPAKQQPCIVIISAGLQQEDIEKLLACGADAACSKPMDLRTISQILENIPPGVEYEDQNISPSLSPQYDSRIS